MGKKMWVVSVKSGRACLRVRGSGVCMSIKAMLGRRRTMWEEGYLRSSSRSRYLVWLEGEGQQSRKEIERTLPKKLWSAKY